MSAGLRDVRAEDAFDVAAVDAWLRPRLADLPPGPPAVSQFSGGASNLTYLLRYAGRELVLRRPPRGTKAASAHDMGREYRLQSALKPVFPSVPAVRALCEDDAVLGAPFYVMDRVPGVVLRARSSDGVPGPAGARALCLAAVSRLAELHAVPVAGAGLADLDRGPGYVRRQVEGWTSRYAAARTGNVPSFDRVTAWLAASMPDDGPHRVVHGDFRLDNLVLSPEDPADIRAVLDWELATVGDPLMDLGSSLAYWVQADDDRVFRLLGRQPTHLPGMLTRREVVAHYAAVSGRSVADWPFYEVFGLFRLAVIIQQIYYRHHRRETRNPAHRPYWLMVHYLHRRCRRITSREG